MSSRNIQPPDSVVNLISPPLVFSDRVGAEPLTDPAALEISVDTDLDSQGRFGSQWLIVAHGKVSVYDDSGSAATTVASLALSEIASAETRPMVGSGVLWVKTVSGRKLDLVRFTPGLTKRFAAVARILDAAAKRETIPIEALDDSTDRKCPNCRLPLPEDTQVCPFCIDRGSTMRRLAGYARRYIGRTVAVMLLSFAGTALQLISPVFTTKVLTDQVLVPHRHENWIAHLVMISVGLALAGLAVNIIRGRVAAWLSNHIVYELRTEVWDKLQSLSVAYFDKRQIGSLQTRVTQDINELQGFLVDGVQVFFVNIITIVGMVVILAHFSPLLTLVAVIPLPIAIVVTRYLFRNLWGRMHRTFYIRSSLGGMVNAALSGIRVVKAFGQENRERERFNSKSHEFFLAQLNYERTWATAFPFVQLVATSGSFLVYYFGAHSVFRGYEHGVAGISLGTLQLLVNYTSMLLAPVMAMSRLPDTVSRSTAAAERVFEVLDAQVEVDVANDAVAMPQLKGRVEIKDVKFSYTTSADVLKGIDLDVRAGEMIGLVGHSGAGKSTLINLLMRFYDVTGGSILIDGVDIRNISLDDYRRQVGVVLQEPYLFPGTVRENISYARADACFEEIVRAAKRANAHDFIVRLQDGYDTYVGERGARLSGGERQRISIARAILHDPRILILDEATASVDTHTEKQIQDAIQFLVKGRTTFAIAHRLSTLRNADRLVVMDHGSIVEVGTHEELLAKPDGVYKTLVELQQAVNRIRDETVLVVG